MANKYLKNILKDIDKSEWKLFPVNKKKIHLPIQLDLFAKDYSKRSHITMGLFYELMCIILFGGKLADHLEIKNGLDNITIKPDIFSPNRKKIIESKAMRSEHQLLLLDDQIERYNICQYLYPDYKIHFVIWRHSLRNIRSYSSSLEKLIDDLCKNTLCCIILPFSIITAIHKSLNFQRYEEDKWDNLTKINSDFINQIFIDQNLFFARIPIERNGFEVEYYNMPNIYFNENKIKSFPVVWIRDNNYKSWSQKIIDKYTAPF